MLVSLFVLVLNDLPSTAIHTLSLHDALPIYADHGDEGEIGGERHGVGGRRVELPVLDQPGGEGQHPQALLAELPVRDRKSTRLNSSHRCISYAVFCLKKKKITNHTSTRRITH